MNRLAIILLSLVLTAGTALAADDGAPPAAKKAPSAAQKAQQEKMKSCNAQAKGKKGVERKASMKECLSGNAAGAAAPVQAK